MADITPVTRKERILSGDLSIEPVTREEILLYGLMGAGGGGGTTNYNALANKPSINGVTLQGDKTATDLGLVGLAAYRTEMDALKADIPEAGSDTDFDGFLDGLFT